MEENKRRVEKKIKKMIVDGKEKDRIRKEDMKENEVKIEIILDEE